MQNKATVFFKGGKKVYTFPFPYLSKQFVKARWDKTNSSVLLEYNRDYTIEGQNLTLVQEGSTEDTLCIYRQTPTDSLVDFNDGSILIASELDKMSVQLLHITEENNDAIHLNGMFTDDDAWQAQGKRIKNVATPMQGGDAVTLSYLDTLNVIRADEMRRIETHVSSLQQQTNSDAGSANQAKTAAETFAKEAERSAQSAQKYERNASQSEESVRSAEVNIAHMETNVTSMVQRINGAEVHAAKAEQAAQSAQESAASAAHSAELAQSTINTYSKAEIDTRLEGITQQSASLFVSKIGDTITGPLTVTGKIKADGGVEGNASTASALSTNILTFANGTKIWVE